MARNITSEPMRTVFALFMACISALSSAQGHDVTNATTSLMGSKAQRIREWQTPINFYGKVVDQDDKPLPGASINFRWTEAPSENGNRSTNVVSDSDGKFSLLNKRGPTLDVIVSKDGYYTSRETPKGFAYAFSNDVPHPDPQKPVVFRLRKKGSPAHLIHIGGIGLRSMRDYSLSANGDPVNISLHDGKVMPDRSDLRVEFYAGKAFAPGRMEWECKIRIPGGGLIQTDEEFPFLAPEKGYESADDIIVNRYTWVGRMNRQYYIRLSDGKFGRVKLRIVATPGNAYFRLESFLNSTGSRNLESDN